MKIINNSCKLDSLNAMITSYDIHIRIKIDSAYDIRHSIFSSILLFELVRRMVATPKLIIIKNEIMVTKKYIKKPSVIIGRFTKYKIEANTLYRALKF